MYPHRHILSLLMLCLTVREAAAAKVPAGFNEDESKVPEYVLPDVLKGEDGKVVESADQWMATRRAEVLRMLETRMFGRAPALPENVRSRISLAPADAVDGLAVRHQVTLLLTDKEDGPFMDVLVYLPKSARGPVPLFWGLNFNGNHSVEADPLIPLSRSLVADDKLRPGMRKRTAAANRGSQVSRYPLEIPLRAGFGVATCCYYDIDPDHDDGFKNGVHAMFPAERNGESWGSIAAWAWGMRVGLEYFLKQKEIDPRRIIAMGHSRLGKAALWAGAQDQRFAMVISNDSGCGGAALSRRRFGETVARINTSFPHWFCMNFHQYNHREDDLPWDQHWLVAAIAPRPVLIHSATGDAWADPKGEYLSGFHAGPVYRLFGKEGLKQNTAPPPDLPVGGTVGYFLRSGEHDVTAADWENYVAFARRELGMNP
jgi:hypothetical protein